MKRRDWLIVGVVLLLSITLFLLRPAAVDPATSTAYLQISAPDQSFELVPLSGSQEILITQPDGSENLVEVFEGGFRMKQSNCSNQDCILQGDVTLENMAGRPLANQIICLPHKVVLELVTTDGQTPEIN